MIRLPAKRNKAIRAILPADDLHPRPQTAIVEEVKNIEIEQSPQEQSMWEPIGNRWIVEKRLEIEIKITGNVVHGEDERCTGVTKTMEDLNCQR